jgi:hypothetical protein
MNGKPIAFGISDFGVDQQRDYFRAFLGDFRHLVRKGKAEPCLLLDIGLEEADILLHLLIGAGTDNKAGGVEQEGVILGHVYILGQRYYLIVNPSHCWAEEQTGKNQQAIILHKLLWFLKVNNQSRP